MKKFITAQQAADRAGLSDRQVRRLADSLGFGFKIGRAWIIPASDMRQLLRTIDRRPAPGRPRTS